MTWWNGMAGWGGWMMGAGMVAFWVLVFLAIVALVPGVRANRADQPRDGGPKDGLRILDERLALGEIDPDDYQVRKELLTHPRHSA